MTVQECYAAVGGNYTEAKERLMKEERILKYLRMFVAGGEMAALEKALAEEKYEDAFLHVHNMKGMSLNLALTQLANVSSVLCEALRGGKPTVDISGMLADLRKTYSEHESAISITA